LKYENDTLSPVSLIPEDCPPGRVLRETGRKLYPNVHPGVTKYHIGVFDATTLFNGFINPNDGVFAEFNNNKPTWLNDGDCSDDGDSDDCSLGDLGQPVYTHGNIVSQGFNISAPDGNDGPNGSNYIALETLITRVRIQRILHTTGKNIDRMLV